LLFIFQISIIASIPANSSGEDVVLESWEDATIGAANLQVTPAQTGTPITGSLSSLKYQKGSSVIVSPITPMGSQVLPNGKTAFKSNVFIEFSVIFWTEYTVNQAVTWTESSTEAQWLGLGLTDAADYCQLEAHAYRVTSYYGKYYYIIPGAISTGAKGFDGYVMLNPTLKDLTPSRLNFESTSVSVSMESFTSVPTQVIILNSKSVNVGDYTTKVNTIGDVGSMSIDKQAPPTVDYSGSSGSCGLGASSASTYFTTQKLGFARLATSNATVQQGKVSPFVIGSDNGLTQGLAMSIIPDIKKMNIPITIRNQYVAVQTDKPWYSTDNPGVIPRHSGALVETTIAERYVAMIVKNYCTYATVRVKFDLYAVGTVTKENDPEQPVLEVPDTQIEDYVWEDKFGGETGGGYAEDSNMSELDILWAQWGWLIITILVVIGLGFFTYYAGPFIKPLLSRLGKKMSKKE
jgi:hypothetical protein